MFLKNGAKFVLASGKILDAAPQLVPHHNAPAPHYHYIILAQWCSQL
jgi:hypothetical protein